MTDSQYDKLYNCIVDMDKRQEERFDALISYLDEMFAELNEKIDSMADADPLNDLIETIEQRTNIST